MSLDRYPKSDYNSKSPISDLFFCKEADPLEAENTLSAKELLAQENRRYNETNLLYHGTAAQFGLSDTVFWVLYSLYCDDVPQTQAQMSAGWCLPKQTLNSAVRGMVAQGLVMLTPAPGCKHGKLLSLTEAGRALAEKTVAQVIRAEETAMYRMGLERARQNLALGQEYMQLLREEFTQLQEPHNKTENV